MGHPAVCHFFCQLVHLSVAHHISGTIHHLIIIFGTHVKNNTSRCLWAVRGVKGQKKPKMKNSNYIHHASYLRNSIAHNHDYWYTCAGLEKLGFLVLESPCSSNKVHENVVQKSLCHTLYFRNHISYNLYLWYTGMYKGIIFSGFFSFFFKILIFGINVDQF